MRSRARFVSMARERRVLSRVRPTYASPDQSAIFRLGGAVGFTRRALQSLAVFHGYLPTPVGENQSPFSESVQSFGHAGPGHAGARLWRRYRGRWIIVRRRLSVANADRCCAPIYHHTNSRSNILTTVICSPCHPVIFITVIGHRRKIKPYVSRLMGSTKSVRHMVRFSGFRVSINAIVEYCISIDL